uniref:Uncharacterized protein n=1 Tax=Anguilla anguilla TaxID=7936 RepID=A0A0E9UD11_ANGAN
MFIVCNSRMGGQRFVS